MIFPRTKFVDTNDISQQHQHIRTEINEVGDELDNLGNVDLKSVAVELFDVIHSAETLLRMLEERHDIDLEEVKNYVLEKNRVRGYYS